MWIRRGELGMITYTIFHHVQKYHFCDKGIPSSYQYISTACPPYTYNL